MLVGPHSKATLARAYAVGTPIVRIGWLDPLEPVDQVSGTDHEAGAAVANYLLELGHRVIAYVHGAPGYRGRIERFYGMREVLEARDDTDLARHAVRGRDALHRSLSALQAEGSSPTAFFCAHDGLAVTVVSELLRLGYRIPEDVSVVGFGDFSSAKQISPELTTVRLPGQEMGAHASASSTTASKSGAIPKYPSAFSSPPLSSCVTRAAPPRAFRPLRLVERTPWRPLDN